MCIACFEFEPKSIHQIARFQFHKYKNFQLLRGAHPPSGRAIGNNMPPNHPKKLSKTNLSPWHICDPYFTIWPFNERFKTIITLKFMREFAIYTDRRRWQQNKERDWQQHRNTMKILQHIDKRIIKLMAIHKHLQQGLHPGFTSQTSSFSRFKPERQWCRSSCYIQRISLSDSIDLSNVCPYMIYVCLTICKCTQY